MVGIDIIRVDRVAALASHDKENKVFTIKELEYVNLKSQSVVKGQSYCERDYSLAGCFCAKEAFLKALNLGLGNYFALNDIEVGHGALGQPFIVKTQKIQEYLNDNNFSCIDLSISHDGEYAIAIVIIN